MIKITRHCGWTDTSADSPGYCSCPRRNHQGFLQGSTFTDSKTFRFGWLLQTQTRPSLRCPTRRFVNSTSGCFPLSACLRTYTRVTTPNPNFPINRITHLRLCGKHPFLTTGLARTWESGNGIQGQNGDSRGKGRLRTAQSSSRVSVCLDQREAGVATIPRARGDQSRHRGPVGVIIPPQQGILSGP